MWCPVLGGGVVGGVFLCVQWKCLVWLFRGVVVAVPVELLLACGLLVGCRVGWEIWGRGCVVWGYALVGEGWLLLWSGAGGVLVVVASVLGCGGLGCRILSVLCVRVRGACWCWTSVCSRGWRSWGWS